MFWPTIQGSSQRKSQQSHTHTHTHSAIGKASLGKVTSTMKHAEPHCWASLPVRHWCGNSHLREIMGWLAPQVWDPGADSLGWRERERRREDMYSQQKDESLSPPLYLSVLLPFLSPSLVLLSWLTSSTILVFKYLLLSILVVFSGSLLLSLQPLCLTSEVPRRVDPECELKRHTSNVCWTW